MGKKKKINSWILLGGFLALMILPFLAWWILKEELDTTNYENRALAQFPVLAETQISEFPQHFENWLGDNAPFRNQMMSLNSAVNRVFGVLDSSDVLMGENGWLFLKDVSDSKSLSDYQGLTVYTDQQQNEIISQLQMLQDSLAQNGSQLLLTFAPAKEGVYSHFMPSYIPIINEMNRVDILYEEIKKQGQVSVVFPSDLLSEASKQQDVYYKYDTHWNEVGAFMAAQEILLELGFPYYIGIPPVAADFSAPVLQDLANVSASWDVTDDDVYWAVEARRAELIESTSDGNISIYRGSGSENLLMIRDSFGEMLAPFLGEPFANMAVMHSNALSDDNLNVTLADIGCDNENLPDYVVVEVAERFSDTLVGQLEGLNNYFK